MSEDRPDVQKGSRGISRRAFLRRGALAAAGGAALAQLATGASTVAVEARHGTLRGPSSELEEKTIKDLQVAMKRGDLTARDLVEMYLERIDALDRHGPHLRSFIETNPDALKIADQLDEERAGGKVRGPLHGIPIALKDNIDTADRMMTTAGSFALAGPPPPQDSTVVERLREAGAIILGKANLSEWANFRSTRSASGWSGRGRLCINPYVLDRSGCGSSTGSAVAAAANLTAVSLGTETNGSIVCPSSVCGVVGIKPTVGLWSRAGVVPIGESQDTVGPIARTVADAATVLGAVTGVDPRDERTKESEGHFFSDYTQFLDADGLRGTRIGIARGTGFGHEHSDKVANAAIDAMREAGAVIVEDPGVLRLPGPFPTTLTQVLLFEFKRDVNKYLETRPDLDVHNLADLIAFNQEDAAREMPYFLQELFLQSQDIEKTFPEDKYREALAANRTFFRKAIDDSISTFSLDAIFAPTRNPAWTVDLLSGDRSLVGSSTAAAVSGFASITVPAGFAFDHLPVGVSFIAGAWTEPKLITIASGFEAATGARKRPGFVPHLDLP